MTSDDFQQSLTPRRQRQISQVLVAITENIEQDERHWRVGASVGFVDAALKVLKARGRTTFVERDNLTIEDEPSRTPLEAIAQHLHDVWELL